MQVYKRGLGAGIGACKNVRLAGTMAFPVGSCVTASCRLINA